MSGSVGQALRRQVQQRAEARWLARARFWVGLFATIYLLIRTPHLVGYVDADAARFAPVGLCAWLPRPVHPATIWAQSLLAPVAAAAFCLGWRYRLTGPLAAFLVAWVMSYRNSFGMVFHTENLLVLHMALLAFAPAADDWSVDTRDRQAPSAAAAYAWPLRLLALATVLTYLVAGLAKLRYGGWGLGWISGDLLRAHVAFDNLRKEAMHHVVAPFGPWLVRQGWAFVPLAFATMVLELGGVFALAHRQLARAWVLMAWGFHAGVLLTMAILFPYPLSGVAFVGLVRADRLWLRRWPAAFARRVFGVVQDASEGAVEAADDTDYWAPAAIR